MAPWIRTYVPKWSCSLIIAPVATVKNLFLKQFRPEWGVFVEQVSSIRGLVKNSLWQSTHNNQAVLISPAVSLWAQREQNHSFISEGRRWERGLCVCITASWSQLSVLIIKPNDSSRKDTRRSTAGPLRPTWWDDEANQLSSVAELGGGATPETRCHGFPANGNTSTDTVAAF